MSSIDYNIIMITVDGLRRDRIDLCPFLCSIAKNNYFFSNMITATPYTIASMHAIFSGIYPSRNGVNSYFNMFRFKKDICKTITEYLHNEGYYTVAEIYSDSIIPHEGFDEIHVYDENKDDIDKSSIELIKKVSKKRKFFLHLQPAHIHRNTVNNIAKRYDDYSKEYFDRSEENVKEYNRYIQEADNYIKTVFSTIDELNLRNNTIVIVLSDHGTSNGEKFGEKMYGCYLYNYTINTFCVICLPNSQPKEIKYMVRSVDIFPTILDLLNIKIDGSYDPLDGKSLMSFILGTENKSRKAFCETGRINKEDISKSEHNIFCIIEENWKLIFNKDKNTYELYNILNDPSEENNLVSTERDIFTKLKKELMIILNKEFHQSLTGGE